jgi:hypothetical protein
MFTRTTLAKQQPASPPAFLTGEPRRLMQGFIDRKR